MTKQMRPHFFTIKMIQVALASGLMGSEVSEQVSVMDAKENKSFLLSQVFEESPGLITSTYENWWKLLVT